MAGKLLKYLPRPTSFSVPSSTSSNKAKAFSGPIASIIPKDARRKKKKGSAEALEDPTSPRVSCIGQIKHNKCSSSSSSNNDKKTKKKHQSFNERIVMKREEEASNKKKKDQSFNERIVEEKKTAKKPSGIQGMFRRKVRPGRPPVPERAEEEVAPEVGRMRRYASGRETLGDFDWRKVVVGPPEEEEEVLVPHSAPMVMGGGGAVAVELEKKKEVNLWKRRTLAPPEPLRV